MAARQAHLPRMLDFQQCEACTYDFATGEGERDCHYYECPYLPESLDARCPTCLFNFYSKDGNPACDDPPDCEFARTIAPERVGNLRRWLESQGPTERRGA